MQFSVWHWAIVLLFIGVPVFFALRSARKPSQNPAELVGFGGWLMLLAIGQTLSPLRTLATLGSSSDGYNQLMLVPNGPVVVYGEVALLLAFLVLQLVVLVAMLRRSRRFKQLFLIHGLQSRWSSSWTRPGFPRLSGFRLGKWSPETRLRRR
ncbi:DUF2569 family protein [Mesorhizobium kowhaii]|uniref:DUF2569 family protein n=1 Tax=Mesorhizobium kowhaii TaxID=1300272 RepID=UPI0035EB9318